MNLADEEIRIKVHEALGWTKRMHGPTHYAWSRGDYWHHLHEVPNYPLDLNACAQFEAHAYQTEPSGWLARYEDELRERCSALQYPHYNPICATPRQRCLAYLKTKGIIQ